MTAWCDFVNNPDENLQKICDHLSDGGDLVQWADARGLKFSYIYDWLQADSARSRRFAVAVEARNERTKSQLLSMLRDLAFCNITDAYNPDGSIKPFSEWSDSAKRAAAEIKVDELFDGKGAERQQVGYTKKIKFVDKIKSIELLMKYHAMLVDRSVMENSVSVNTETIEALSQLPAEKLTDMILGRK